METLRQASVTEPRFAGLEIAQDVQLGTAGAHLHADLVLFDRTTDPRPVLVAVYAEGGHDGDWRRWQPLSPTHSLWRFSLDYNGELKRRRFERSRSNEPFHELPA